MTEADKKKVRIWYWSGATLVFIILIIGGITRLTGSGLSISDWDPIMGAIPPITEADWNQTFDEYKQFPEYQKINTGMSLEEFKFIFFWEYMHRLAGRVLGLVFLIPFVWFVAKKKFDKVQLKRAVLLMVLGLSQGLMGWYMVMSGLVDIPQVSPYRLAAHLMLAFLIFGLCVWFALDLKEKKMTLKKGTGELTKWLNLLLTILVLQVFWGALVAGHHAGHVYNTFPKMFQYWAPPELWLMEPFILNFFDNVVTVQWMHRVLGTLLAGLVIIIGIRSYVLKAEPQVKIWSLSLFGFVLVQYLIGVFTLVFHVPVWLGVLHQAVAMLLFGFVIAYIHFLKLNRG